MAADSSRNWGANKSKLKPLASNSATFSEAPIETKVAVPSMIPIKVARINGTNFVRSIPAA